jgi:hypothetical protein
LPPLAAFAIPLGVYLLGFRYVGSGDTQPAELLPITLLREGNFDFDEFVPPGGALPYWFHRVGGHVVSSYPILPGLLNLPAFAVADAAGLDIHRERERLSLVTASLVCSLSVLFLFQILQRFCSSRRVALGFALVYAFGTCVWSVASRALWQHGPSLLFLTAALLLLLGEGRASVGWSGFFLALAIVNRPTNVALAAPLALFVLLRRRDALPLFASLSALPLLLHAAYASACLASPFSTGYWNAFPQVAHFRGNPVLGLAGLLVSPSRGLFVFSPIFLFALPGVMIALRGSGRWPTAPFLAWGTVLYLLLYSRWSTWWAGHTFGYRYLIELLPGLMIFLAIGWEERIRRRPVLAAAFFACLAWSVFVHWLGAWFQPSGFNQKMDENPAVLWSIRDSEIVMSTKKAVAWFERSRP